eukprot:jgi/Bigna1/57820/fgenesh1_pm.31_\
MDASKTAQILLGRAGEHLKMGIVGLPNVGKSSLFNLMSKLQVPAENYPFCTIEPNIARMKVPDPRFDWLCQQFSPKSTVCAYLEVTDIAGLVRGAADGQGLGNKFLSHIYAVDGIYHVVRAFKDETVEHVEGSVDPVRDLEIITTELRNKDKELMAARVSDLARKVVTAETQCDLLTAKPVIFLINVHKDDVLKGKNKWFLKIKRWVDVHSPGSKIMPFSVSSQGYKSLRLIHFFTTGTDEVKCWTIRNGTNAQRAAGTIHSDMERGFICAETMHYRDFHRLGSEAEVTKAGLKAMQGKNYIVEDGDIIFFKFNAAGGSKKKK